MLASALIIGFSLVLLVYWFRYSCVLLLRTNQPAAESTPQDPRFSYDEVRKRLASEEELGPLHDSLRHDYEVFIYLVEHASGLKLETIEDRLLVFDLKLMQAWYKVTRALFPSQARGALSEMASALDVLVRRMGEQAGVYTKA